METFIDKVLKFFSTPKGIIGGLIAVGILVFTITGITSYVNVRNTGNDLELGLTEQFKRVQINYGQFRLKIHDELGIAREKRDAIDKILGDAVAGRYNQQGSDTNVDREALFSAIKEAYPDLSGLDIYDRIIDDIQAGRTRFAAEQVQLADQVRRYNSWRKTGGLFHPLFVSWLGFPSDLLEVQIGSKTLTGAAALQKMNIVIVGGDTVEIFDTGFDKPIGK